MVENAWQAMAAILLGSLSVTISDVIVDSLVVERARKESFTQSGSLQSLTWGISALGGLITAYLGGWLLAHLGTRPVFALTAIFPLIASAMAFLITEEKVKNNNDESQSTPKVKEQIGQLWSAIRQKSIFRFVFACVDSILRQIDAKCTIPFHRLGASCLNRSDQNGHARCCNC